MADKYRKIRREPERLPENEIRVRRDPRIGKYLRRANDILTGKIPEANNTVVIKGISIAMENAVKLAELIKHRFTGLYQLNQIDNIEIADEYEPLEEGLDRLVFKRNSTMLTITLSRSQLDKREVGYQDPIPDSEVSRYEEREQRAPSEGGDRRREYAPGPRQRSRSRR